jgi:hypothetical protein
VIVPVINARVRVPARACVSPGGGRAALEDDAAAEELPALAGLYPACLAAVCRRFAAYRILHGKNFFAYLDSERYAFSVFCRCSVVNIYVIRNLVDFLINVVAKKVK